MTLLLHTPTVIVMDMTASVVMAMALIVVHPKERQGVDLWAWSLVMYAITFLLFALRSVPAMDIPWLSIVLANTCLSSMLALQLMAIAQFRQRSVSRWLTLGPLVMVGVLMALLLGDYRARVLVSSFFLASQLCLMLWALWRPTAVEQRSSALLMTVPIVAQALVLLVRTAWLALIAPEQTHLLASGGEQIMTFYTNFVFNLTASLGFILMNKDKADAVNQRLAQFDELTNIPNRRLLAKGLQRDMARAARLGEDYSVMIVDIDHFKRVNDTCGHLAGDAVLRHVARQLQSRLRRQDMVGRWGGEEFLALLPTTDTYGAFQLAETLRKQIATTPCEYEGRFITVHISIGLCADILLPDEDRPRLLVAGADKALYRAKEAGRNRVEVATLERSHGLPDEAPADGQAKAVPDAC